MAPHETDSPVSRPTTEADLPDLLALWNDGRVMQWVGFRSGLCYDLERARGWFQRLKSDPARHHFVVHAQGVGFCGELCYAVDSVHRRAGLDIKFVPAAQGKGLATKALRALVDLVFRSEPQVDAVWTEPALNNAAARRLYGRCGLKPTPRPADMTAGSSYWELRRDSDLRRYYAEQAGEYDRVYEKPERQNDLARLREKLCRLLTARRVLEIACGTGYWTEPVGPVAKSVLATDINPEVLSIARHRCGGIPSVRFMEADAYTLAGVERDFTAALAAFWWSHVPRSRIPAFLSVLHLKLASDALVVLMDNRFVPGSSTPISRTDQEGNTYQQRQLADGRTYEVLKNFPDEAEIGRCLAGQATEVRFERLTYYWLATYRISR